jgi:hypothetical protein
MSPGDTRSTSSQPDLGSAAEEAARLIEALRRWVDDRGMSVPPVATGAAECKLCPFCQLLAVLRDGQPEVFEHVGAAAESLFAAARSAIADHERRWSKPAHHDVEHINLDE